jgi:SAM-dependent methyltransferase
MKIMEKLRARLGRGSFQPTILNLVGSPDYIIRRGLYLAIKVLAPTITGNVLDFGCGSKPYESLFSEAASYIGVDLEATGHDHSNSKIDVLYDGKVLPFKDGQFDAVVSFEVLEHVFNLSEVMREINRVTTDSGYLLISVPFAWLEHEIPYDFARYTSFGITHIVKQAGYEIIEIRKTTTYLLAVFQIFLAYLTQAIQLPRVLRPLRQLCIVFPCTVAAYAFDAALPKRHEYFCNTVLLARKVASKPAEW